ncbi:ubiquitin carboxyl-terminal hydrolase 26 isoform X2 [Oryzias melastigma]|uniref:ubiquitin carboxyl-terminal hydrolase 26 isoform X2 n=1 Tax=Oryzias melastigma TaxID=30732 RepID=UPI000CF810BF|nr:ubiquitin carboxyl-terminal hydrolase 26 isoform X2 [Oryzias melastigma]
MVDLQLLLFISIIVFFCRCCFSKLNMSEYCRKFTESVNANSPFRYHSLMNHGATCYLNSVLQVLFMTEDFREAVNSSKSGFIDHHLKDLFKRLLTQTSDAYRIIQALGIEKVNEQQDAAEYLQKILRMTSPEAAQIFHGEMTERSSCLSCQKQVQTNVPFWLLPLSLGEPESENSVDGSIKNFFKISYFRGEDQMYCDNCDRKTDAAGMSVVKHHPDVLILLLKRFVFSYDYMSYVKINCAVEVPFSLNIPENQTYELYAVIDHFGDLRSGHYTSRIRSQQESRWLQFNSSSVSALEGCELSQKGDTESSSSAYLLFYRKKDTESTLTVNGGSPPAIRGDPGAEKREHSRDEENRLLHEVSPKTQNPSRNEPFALEEMDISDRYSVEPELNDNVNGLGRTDVESEERDRLQQHSELNVEEEMRNVNDAEHLSLRQNERKDADFDGNVSDKQMKTDVEDEGVKDNRITETGSAPEVQDRRERSNSGALCLDPLQEEEEEEGGALDDEDPRPSQERTAVIVESVDPQNKRKLPEDLNTPEQETCVKRRAQNEENPSVKQENGGQGLEQRGEAEDQRWEEPGLDGFQTGSGFQDGRRSSKQMNVKVLVLEEEEREKAIGSKNIVIKVLEETLYSSVQTYHGHNEHVSQEKYSDEQQ